MITNNTIEKEKERGAEGNAAKPRSDESQRQEEGGGKAGSNKDQGGGGAMKEA